MVKGDRKEIRIDPPKGGFEYFSPQGIEIHTICKLFSDPSLEKIPQKNLPMLSKNWIKAGVLDPKKFKAIGFLSELSESKKAKSKTKPERIKEIWACLRKMLELRGYYIERLPSSKDNNVSISRTFKKQEPFIYPPEVNTSVFEENGLVDFLSTGAWKDNKFETALDNAYGVEILQSSLNNWSLTTRILEDALNNGKLCRIKFLLGQPYSNIVEGRSHTFGLSSKNQFNFMNGELEKAIVGIHDMIKEYHGKLKPGTTDKFDIQLRIYYRYTSIPIYRFLDSENENMVTFWGIYWQHASSIDLPHFEVRGSDSVLENTIKAHFDNIWEDIYVSVSQKFSWKKHLGEQKTLIVDESTNTNGLLKNLRKAYELKHFAHLKKDFNWISFKCFYHNFSGELSDMLLQIDPVNRVAKVSETSNGNEYCGTATKLHNTYSVFLHTKIEDSDRTVFINIPIGSSNLDSEKTRFGIYNNCDVNYGSPYASIMILQLIKDVDLYDEIDNDWKRLEPDLKDKKIFLPPDIWNPRSKQKKKNKNEKDKNFNIKYNFTYYYQEEEKEKETYYNLFIKEISKAKTEVYFLGHGPVNFLNAPDDFVKKYLGMHEDMLRRGVKIYRILLNPDVNVEFINSVRSIKEDIDATNNFKLFAAKHKIPFIADLALIDPNNKKKKKALLSHTISKNGDDYYPTKLEVLKGKSDSDVIDNLHTTCRDAMKNVAFIEELKTMKDVEKRFGIP